MTATGADAYGTPLPPGLSVVIVNWNTADLLDAVLRSVYDHPPADRPFETIVVDNGSTDGSAGLVQDRWPEVRLLANPTNVGYTRANNQALAVRRYADALLLNADAEVTAGCIDTLLARLEADPDAAVVGPRLVYPDGMWQRWTAGRAPGPVPAAGHFLGLDRLPGWRGGSPWLVRDVCESFTPDWVSSACMLVRGRALDLLNGLAETYATYMDDVDLCQRARDLGWRVWYEPAAEAIHVMGGATRRRTGTQSPAALRNFNDYVERRHGPRAAATVRAVELIGFSARAAMFGAASFVPGRTDLRARARAHARHARLCLQRGAA